MDLTKFTRESSVCERVVRLTILLHIEFQYYVLRILDSNRNLKTSKTGTLVLLLEGEYRNDVASHLR